MEYISFLTRKLQKLFTITEYNKLQFLPTLHELPLNTKVIKEFLKSPKIKRKILNYISNFEKFLPYLIPHKRLKKYLFCTITKKKISKNKITLKNHINSKKFRKKIFKREKTKKNRRGKILKSMKFLMRELKKEGGEKEKSFCEQLLKKEKLLRKFRFIYFRPLKK